ncbi:MAG: extracellular solute-binding protein [Treponema sp.]|jgi:ABC-type glycerol-3-phosphate transport system substrate-binding protein|nr:extracellular solute-binding protein [Treponema sp.]
MLKKTARILFFALMVCAAFPAWSLGGADSLKGVDVVIGNWWADWDSATRKANSDAEEKLIAYRAKIQRDGGFKIREKNISSWEQMAQLAATSIMAGRPAASIFVLQPNWAMMLYNQKLLYPISDSKVIKFDSKKPVEWNQDVIKAFTFGGKAYAFSVGYGTSQHANGVFFNKRLFREAGLNPNLPYDMQKAGTWTWNAFLDLCKRLTRDINNDGIKDTYAMTADLSTEMLDAIVASNGANYVDKDRSGKFVNATNRPEFLEALQFALRLNNEGVLMPRPEDSNWDWYRPMFHDGKVAMMVSQQYVAQELRDMTDDWGFVLFPKGPRSKTYRYSSDENVMVIPSTFKSEEVEKILYAFQLWSTPVDDDPDAWKDDQYNIYRDSRAVDETLAMIRDPMYGSMKYYLFIPGLERGDIAWNMWFEGADPAQLVESVSQSWNALINEANGIIK